MTRATILILLASTGGFAQSAAPTFDVASVKPHRDATSTSYFQFLPGGRFHAVNTWIKFVVEKAYDLNDYQVSGGPAWIRSDRFDIEAKAGDASADGQQMRQMLQTLLAERFQLKVRQQTKEFPVHDLVVAKGGPKIRVLKLGDQSNCQRENSEFCGLRTMPQLANFLTQVTGRPVFDKTEIKGDYDLLLNFDVYEARNETAPPNYDKPSLTTALQEQLGLKLEPRKASLPLLVIESIHRPTEN